MSKTVQNLDSLTRHLIRGVEPDLRRHLRVRRLDRDLVSDLYVRVRDVLSIEQPTRHGTHAPEPENDLLVDQLVLTIFLTIAAGEGDNHPAPELMEALRRSLAAALILET